MTLLLLAWFASAWALDWWVPDAATGARIDGALDRLWATGDVTVRVGPPGGEGAWYADGRLVLVTPAGRRELVVADDPDTLVVLVRAWTRAPGRIDAPGLARSRWIPAVALTGGPGFAVAKGGAPVHVAASGGASWRSLELGVFLLADVGAVLASDAGAPVGQARVGGGVMAGARLPLWGGEYVNPVGPMVRARRSWEEVAPAGEATEVVVGVAERMAWWGRATPAWTVGVGLSASVDDVPDALDPARVRLSSGHTVAPLPGQVALEIGAAWRPLPGAR